jgi:hypothetical protein
MRLVALAVLVTALIAGPAQSGSSTSVPQQLWARRVSAISADDLVVSPNGTSVFVVGSSSANNPEIVTTGYQVGSGTLEWSVDYQGPGDGATPAAIGISPDGSTVFVTGTIEEAAANRLHIVTLAYSATDGTSLWERRFAVTEGDMPVDLAVGPTGSAVFVFGQAQTRGGTDFETVAYDGSTGAELWHQFFSSPGKSDDQTVGGTVSPDGSTVYVTGVSPDPGTGTDFTTVAYQVTSGAQSWTASYHDDARPYARPQAIATSPDGSRVFVTGCIDDGAGDPGCPNTPDYATVAYDAFNGTQEWVATYDDAAHGADNAMSVGVNTSGTLAYVTGTSDQAGTSSDLVTIAYHTDTGAQAWLADEPAPTLDVACCLTVAGSRVLVTGSSGTRHIRWLTVAYDPASGQELWSINFPEQGAALAPSAIGITQNSQVAFVAGQVPGEFPNPSRGVIVAYRTTPLAAGLTTRTTPP